MKAKPYLDIIKELGYFVVEEDTETTYDTHDLYEEDVYYSYYVTYGKGEKARIELYLIADGLHEVSEFMKSNNYGDLRLEKLRAYYNDEYDGAYDESDESTCLIFYEVSTQLNDEEVMDINRLTPELFRTILKVKESKEAESEYSHKILQRYLDAYYNIIVPIVNPVVKLKGIKFESSVLSGFKMQNRNIELDYYSKDDAYIFTIGVDYLTGKLYFYVDSGNVMFDFESKVTTKGRLLELLKSYGI